MPEYIYFKGFSLLETLICIAVLSIVATLAAPTFVSMITQRQLIATAEAIAGDLRWARSEALKSANDISVFFEPGAANAWRYQLTNATGVTLKTITSETNPEFTKISLTENFREHSTTFNSTRGTAEAKNGTIILGAMETELILEVVLSNLGRVTICAKSSNFGTYPKCT